MNQTWRKYIIGSISLRTFSLNTEGNRSNTSVVGVLALMADTGARIKLAVEVQPSKPVPDSVEAPPVWPAEAGCKSTEC